MIAWRTDISPRWVRKTLALDADDIADVILLEAVVVVLVHLVLAGVELDSAFLVLQIAERDLAHAALGHHAPGDGNRLAPPWRRKFSPDFAAVGGLDKFRDLKRVVTLCLQICELLPADLDLIADGKLLRAVLILLFLLHLNSPLFSRKFRFFIVLRFMDL